MPLRNREGFVSLIGLLIVLVIISYLVMGSFFGNQSLEPSVDDQTNDVTESYGAVIDRSSYKSILDSTKSEIRRLEEESQRRADNLFKDAQSGY